MLIQNFKLSLLVLLSGLSTLTVAQQTDNLSMYPQAGRGQKRVVIHLPQKSDEELFMIELIPGKNATVDCNNYSYNGKIEEKSIDGWGYSYFSFTSDGQMMGTKMGCPGVKQTKFISARSKTTKYNSKLPIVVYLPANFTVKYRVWSAGTLVDTKDEATSVVREGTIKVTDVLSKMGMTTFQYGTHMIGKYAVRSSKADLKKYEGKKVTILGKKVSGYPLEGGPDLLEITSIQEAK